MSSTFRYHLKQVDGMSTLPLNRLTDPLRIPTPSHGAMQTPLGPLFIYEGVTLQRFLPTSLFHLIFYFVEHFTETRDNSPLGAFQRKLDTVCRFKARPPRSCLLKRHSSFLTVNLLQKISFFFFLFTWQRPYLFPVAWKQLQLDAFFPQELGYLRLCLQSDFMS